LVPQYPSDEPASVLLDRIALEKAQLLKEGKTKKPKALSEISEDEKPFELPHGWEWARLQDIGHDWGQKKPDCEFTYIDVGAINKELGFVDQPSVLTESKAPSRARKLVRKGTVIYSTVRPYLLNIAIINEHFDPEPIASTAFAIIHPFDGLSSSFIYRYLRSPSFITYVEGCQTGIAYPAINDKQFYSGVLPVPPLAEQHRIVAKVDELMALCGQLEQQTEASINAHATLVETLLATLTDSADASDLEQNWTRIADHFDTLFTTDHSIDQLKQTVLQLAVMGKLVPQDPFDEPASVLLGRIAAEKAQLVKEKKIKKQNALPSIVEDEKPFDLPQGWEWVRFGSICEIERGGSPRPIKSFLTDEPDGLNWIKIGDTNIGGKYITSTNEKIRKEGLKKTRKVYPGDFLLTNSMSFGRPYITKIEGCIHDGWLRISPPDCLDKDYLYNLLSSPYVMRSFKSAAAGAVVMNLNAEKVRVVCILLPPLEEQHRIVAKVDQLMALCDQLKVQLQQAQQTKLHLADELVSTALV